MCGRFFISLLILLSLIPTTPLAMLAQSGEPLRTPHAPVTSPPHDPVILPPHNPVIWPSRDPVLPPRQPPPLKPVPLPLGPLNLPQMVRAAGLIFSGRVTAIARGATSGGQAIETVAVTFHVEHAIRGVRKGETLTIVQWAGLWSGGGRYRVGERLLLFLYPPSRLGLTSPVGGPLGRFDVDPIGRVLLSDLHSSAFAADPVLSGRLRVSFRDFAQGLRRASGEE